MSKDAYFIVTVSDYDHDSWRWWCKEFPEARVSVVTKGKPFSWVRPDALPRPAVRRSCEVAVGVPGILHQTEMLWMISGVPLTPAMVRQAQSTPMPTGQEKS